jgi:hypothetical protein
VEGTLRWRRPRGKLRSMNGSKLVIFLIVSAVALVLIFQGINQLQ